MAPKPRALAASSGVSALAITFSRATWSAHLSRVSMYSLNSACTVGTSPAYTLPLPPSMVTKSPSCRVVSPMVAQRLMSSMWIASQPETQGLPMPRATTAACEVLPLRLVRMPWAWKKPWMSSGFVSSRTRMMRSPLRPRASAVSASNTILPEAAPGEAGRLTASGLPLKSGASCGTRSCSSIAGSMRSSAFSLVTRPSLNISTDVRTIAVAFILPLRVCRQ